MTITHVDTKMIIEGTEGTTLEVNPDQYIGNDNYKDEATYWDEATQRLVTVVIAHWHAGGAGGKYYDAHIDAPAEVQAKAAAYRAYQARKARVQEKLERRADLIKRSRETGLSYPALRYLQYKLPADVFVWIADKLRGMKNGRLRSDFAKDICRQVVMWLADDNPKYDTPLSPHTKRAIAEKVAQEKARGWRK